MPENLERRGKVWYFRGMIGGQLYRQSTGFTDLARARRRASEIENDIRAGRLGWTPKAAPLFSLWVDRYLAAYHNGRRTEATLLQRPLDRWGTRPLNTIQPSDATAYLRERQHQGAAAGTLERERVLLKALFRAAVADKIVEDNPFDLIRGFRPHARTRVLTKEEEAAVRSLLLPHWDRFLTFALTTGLRAGELRGACPGDLREHGAWLWVRPELNKTRTGRLVPLREETREALAVQQAARPGGDNAPYFPCAPNAPKVTLHRACKKLKITPPVTCHDLRRTFGTRCAEGGMLLSHLQKILGHSSPTITAKYYVHLQQVSLADAMGKVTL